MARGRNLRPAISVSSSIADSQQCVRNDQKCMWASTTGRGADEAALRARRPQGSGGVAQSRRRSKRSGWMCIVLPSWEWVG